MRVEENNFDVDVYRQDTEKAGIMCGRRFSSGPNQKPDEADGGGLLIAGGLFLLYAFIGLLGFGACEKINKGKDGNDGNDGDDE